MCWKTKGVRKVSDGIVHPFLDPCVHLYSHYHTSTHRRTHASISWPVCASVCWSRVMAIHLHRRSSVKVWIFVQTSTPAWAGSTEPECWMVWTVSVFEVTWSDLYRCWGDATCLKVSLNSLKMKMPQMTLLSESSSVRSVAWKSNGNTMKCFNHAHKNTEIIFNTSNTVLLPVTFSKCME